MGSHCLSGSCPGLCAVPPQQYGAIVKPQFPLQLGGMLQAVKIGSGIPGAVLSHPNCSLATHLPQLQYLLCCYFLGVPGQGWLRGGALATDSCTPLSSVSPALKPLLPC